MMRINLLPQEERQSKWQFHRIFTMVSLVIGLLCISIYAYGEYQIWSVGRQLQEAGNQYQLLRPTQEKMLAAGNKQQSINAKNNILLTLTTERKSWYSILARLGAVVPPAVWLTDLSMTDATLLRLSCMAVSYPDAADFLRRLEKDDMFNDLTLIKAEHGDMALPVTKFEITVKLKGM